MFRLSSASTGSLSGLKSARNVHLGMNGRGYDNVATHNYKNHQKLIRNLSGPKAPDIMVPRLPNIRQQSQDLAAFSFARSGLEANKFNPASAALRTVLDISKTLR